MLVVCHASSARTCPLRLTPQSNFETFDLPDNVFNEINEWGKKTYVRGNIPAEYKPK